MSNFQLSEGYQQTEVGVIPEDWDVLSLGEVLTFQNGVNADKSFYGHGIPFINISEVMAHTHLKASDIPGLVSLSKQATDLYRVYQGDILFNRTSETQEELGLTSVYLDNEVVVFGGFVIRGRQKSETLDITYSSYALRSSGIRTQITSRGQGVVRANIGQKDLSKIQICVPPLPEQRSIATVLSDMDALLGTLDQLIAKKRDLKQATMQQLLTGKKRLPGFGEGEWKIFKIGDLFEITAGGDLEKAEYSEINDDSHPYPIYANSVSNGGLYGYSSFKEYENGCITVTARGTLGVACYRHIPFVAIGRLLVLTPKDELDSFFLSETINHRLEFASESTGVPQLTAPQIAKYNISIPDVEEQRAIATVLSDMDTELAALEQRRDKTRALKQGMMQELLTGRIRLKIEA